MRCVRLALAVRDASNPSMEDLGREVSTGAKLRPAMRQAKYATINSSLLSNITAAVAPTMRAPSSSVRGGPVVLRRVVPPVLSRSG